MKKPKTNKEIKIENQKAQNSESDSSSEPPKSPKKNPSKSSKKQKSKKPKPQKELRNSVDKERNNEEDSSDIAQTLGKVSKKAKNKLIRLKELFLGKTKKQKLPDKPTFVGKKMLLLLFLFIGGSLILFLHMNLTFGRETISHQAMNWIVLNDPYVFGFALTYTFIELGILFTNEKVLKWFFETHFVVKQLIAFVGLNVLNFLLGAYLTNIGADTYSMLLGLATIWMVLQSVRLYSGTRRFATKLEAKWTQKYSKIRYLFAILAPFIILGGLVVLMWTFRYYIVIFTLDVLGPAVPNLTYLIYDLEMSIVMPIGYISLILIFVFMITNGIITRRMGDTKRAGAFDNLTYAIISFIMFLFVMYNILLYLFLNETMIDGISGALGGTGNSRTLFIVEFSMTILFLIWLLNDLRKEFKSGFFFFTNDGFVMVMFGTIMAQTTSRLGVITDQTGEISGVAEFLTLDYIMIPVFIILFLGITLLIYYIHPQKASMFLHVSESQVEKQDKSMDTILKFLKREFIRRGEKYEINDRITTQIRAITQLPKGVIWSLIYRLDEKYMDIQLLKSEDSEGEERVFMDFLPITEKYQSNRNAETKANQYMRERFTDLISSEKRKRIKLYSGKKSSLSSSKQSDLFMQALGIQYGRKIKDEEAQKQTFEEQQLIIDKAIDSDTKDLIMELIRREYITRITHVSDFPDFKLPVSEISRKIENATRVSPGRLYPLLEEIAEENSNLNLIEKEAESAYKTVTLIEIIPIDDFEIYEALAEYRPNDKKNVVLFMQDWFAKAILYKRARLNMLPPKKYKDEDEEFRRSYRSKWFAKTMRYFAKNFSERQKCNQPHLNADVLERAIKNLIEGKEHENEKNHKRKIKKYPSYSYQPETD